MDIIEMESEEHDDFASEYEQDLLMDQVMGIERICIDIVYKYLEWDLCDLEEPIY